jgi:hypothetical protein
VPLSPVFRQIVTCRTPRRILCAGAFDMMFLLLFGFRPRPSGAYGTPFNRP